MHETCPNVLLPLSCTTLYRCTVCYKNFIIRLQACRVLYCTCIGALSKEANIRWRF
jgi:hypothetical protein